MNHTDPRSRRRHEHGAPPVDALAAAVRLDSAIGAMRARTLAGGPEPLDDEPPTGMLDLAALRAMVGTAAPGEDVDPAAAAWLAGGPDPAAARVVEQVDRLAPATVPAPVQVPVTPAAGEPAPALVPGDSSVTTRAGSVPSGDVVRDHAGADVRANAALDAVRGDAAPARAESGRAPGGSDDQADAATFAAGDVGGHVTKLRPSDFRYKGATRSSNDEPRPGWSSRHDPRSLGFHVRADLAGSTPLQDVDLPVGPVLDQGQEGECVGCGTADAVNVLRLLAGRADLLKIDAAAGLYHEAQRLDDVPGEDYAGTSVLAGMKAAAARGWIGTYRWAFGTRDVAQSILTRRPVVVGVPWLSGMYDTGPGGLVQVTGDDRGEGHCLVVAKLRLRGPQGQPGPYFGWQNSWGRSYGDGGIGWIHHKDLASLLHGSGEAAVPSLGPS